MHTIRAALGLDKHSLHVEREFDTHKNFSATGISDLHFGASLSGPELASAPSAAKSVR